MMTTPIAYLNSPALKAAVLAEITTHEAQGAVIKGITGAYGRMNETFTGCAIGCTLHSLNVLQGKTGAALTDAINQHARYPVELGWPLWLAHLEDVVFEHLPDALATTWPRRLAEAIPVGASVDDLVLAKILRWMLADAESGVRAATTDARVQENIDVIVAMFDAEIATGGQATAEQREAAAVAAWDARDAPGPPGTAWTAWTAWTARDAGDAGWDAWPARAAWAAARAAGDAGAAKADAFFPGLSHQILHVLREDEDAT